MRDSAGIAPDFLAHSVDAAEHNRGFLMASVDRPTAHELRHAVEPALLFAVHQLLLGIWDAEHDMDPLDRATFATAVAELVANLVEHADGATTAVVRVDVHADRIEGELRDDGAALAPDVIQSAALPDDPHAESGRGLVFAREAVHVLRYDRIGDENRWLIVRRRS